MSKACVFFADGMEECEALIVVDLRRRAGGEVTTASVNGTRTILSTHKIPVGADALAEEVDCAAMDLLVLPGGMPGTLNLGASAAVTEAVKAAAADGRLVAAICAAPSVLGDLGLLAGREAICYPGFEGRLTGASVSTEKVAVSGNITTAQALGSAIPFALALIRQLEGPDAADAVAKAICC